MNCPICASAVEEIPPVADAVSINCPRCGGYSISGTVADTEIIQRTEPERLRKALANAKARAEPGKRPLIQSYDL